MDIERILDILERERRKALILRLYGESKESRHDDFLRGTMLALREMPQVLHRDSPSFFLYGTTGWYPSNDEELSYVIKSSYAIADEFPDEYCLIMIRGLNHEKESVRVLTIEQLGNVAHSIPRTALCVLRQAFYNEDDRVNHIAAVQLAIVAKTMPEEVLSVFRKALDRQEVWIASSACENLVSLAQTRPKEAIEWFGQQFSHESWYVKTAAAKSLPHWAGRFPDETLGWLEQALDDEDNRDIVLKAVDRLLEEIPERHSDIYRLLQEYSTSDELKTIEPLFSTKELRKRTNRKKIRTCQTETKDVTNPDELVDLQPKEFIAKISRMHICDERQCIDEELLVKALNCIEDACDIILESEPEKAAEIVKEAAKRRNQYRPKNKIIPDGDMNIVVCHKTKGGTHLPFFAEMYLNAIIDPDKFLDIYDQVFNSRYWFKDTYAQHNFGTVAGYSLSGLIRSIERAHLVPIEDDQLRFLRAYVNSRYVLTKRGHLRSERKILAELAGVVKDTEREYRKMWEITEFGGAANLQEIIGFSKIDTEEIVLKKLGSGVAGTTYLVRSEKLGKLLAMKLFKKGTYSENESRILSSLVHDNVVRIWYASGSIVKVNREPVYAMLMDYVDGQTIREMVDSHPGGLEERQVIEYSGQLLEGIAYLRKQGVFHRDIHPKNVKLNSSGCIKIMDFGIATTEHGSPPKDNRRYGGPNDVFSWALMTYEMLTCQHLLLERMENMGTATFADSIKQLKMSMREKDGSLKEEYRSRVRDNVPAKLQEPLFLALENTSDHDSSDVLEEITRQYEMLRVDRRKKSELEMTIGKEISDKDYFRIISVAKGLK